MKSRLNTSNVRKSLDVMSDELVALFAAPFESEPVTLGLAVPCVLFVAAVREDREEATLVAAGEPTPVIELACRISITFSCSIHADFC